MALMSEWVAKSQPEVAAFFGVHRDTVKVWRGQGMPGEARHYPLDEIAQWLRKFGPWKPQARQSPDESDTLLVSANDSPELERYRAARADLAEMERDERRRKLLGVERVREICLTVGDVIKSLRRRLRKRFGEEAGQLIDEGLRDLRDIADRECGPDIT